MKTGSVARPIHNRSDFTLMKYQLGIRYSDIYGVQCVIFISRFRVYHFSYNFFHLQVNRGGVNIVS